MPSITLKKEGILFSRKLSDRLFDHMILSLILELIFKELSNEPRLILHKAEFLSHALIQ